MARLAQIYARLCVREVIGESTQGRPLHAFRLRGAAADDDRRERPRLLVTAHIHAVEYIGSYVARAVARRLLEGYETNPQITALLDRADVWIVPLLNPDGAARIWRSRGWTRLGGARFTANRVDPNRNFPFAPIARRRGWNSSSARPGSPYYRGPHPLSEPECRALARLCARERFCGAINLHSCGCVVFLPRVDTGDGHYTTTTEKARHALAVFQGESNTPAASPLPRRARARREDHRPTRAVSARRVRHHGSDHRSESARAARPAAVETLQPLLVGQPGTPGILGRERRRRCDPRNASLAGANGWKPVSCSNPGARAGDWQSVKRPKGAMERSCPVAFWGFSIFSGSDVSGIRGSSRTARMGGSNQPRREWGDSRIAPTYREGPWAGRQRKRQPQAFTRHARWWGD